MLARMIPRHVALVALPALAVAASSAWVLHHISSSSDTPKSAVAITNPAPPGGQALAAEPSSASLRPEDFAGEESGAFYFVTPAGTYECAIRSGSVAGCHGALPPGAPQVPSSLDPAKLTAPNAVEVTPAAPGRFTKVGAPEFHRFAGSATVLEYRMPLRAGGFTCSTDVGETVTCASAANMHGFTIAPDKFRLW